MKWSHSKLSCILKNPAEYYLIYKAGIFPKVEKSALTLGSAVHWGIEHNTSDLSDYFKNEYFEDRLLAEAMVKGYLLHKESLFKQILNSSKLIEEIHEIYLNGKFDEDLFVGIIDLLLLTDKGFIVIDYKTSSSIPDWDKYLDQIYRYIFLLKEEFPEVPVYKIGIINLRKSKLRKKINESKEMFSKRLLMDYELNDEKFIDYHEYEVDKLNKKFINEYIDNLRLMVKTANLIESNNCFYINYSSIEDYGGSSYKNIYMNVEGSYIAYKISDKYIDDYTGEIVNYRDCNDLDIKELFNEKLINKYEKFKVIFEQFIKDKNFDLNEFINYLNASEYIFNEELINNYINVYKLEEVN